MDAAQPSKETDGLPPSRGGVLATLLLLRRSAIMIAIGAVAGACTCWATYYFGLLSGLLGLFFTYVLFSHARDVDALLKCTLLFPPEKAPHSLRWGSAAVGVLAVLTALLGFARFVISILGDKKNNTTDASGANGSTSGVDMFNLIASIIAIAAFNLVSAFSFIAFLKLKGLESEMTRAGLSFTPSPSTVAGGTAAGGEA